MTKAVVQVKNLQKSFKDTSVLRGVDFEIQQGQIFALLGQNGAGKTTVIQILSTLLKADAGQVMVAGYDIDKQPEEVRANISLTGQFAAVDDMLTGRENLELIAKLRAESNPKQTSNDLLRRFGLEDAAGQIVSTYSGGMKRRLDISMSLIGTPAVIFLDEPTTGLDPEARLEVWKTVKDLANNGTTILLTTQHLEEAEYLATKIAILHNGTIIANGTLDDLKKLIPPVKKEYVEKQPSLEEIFFAITGKKEAK